MRLREDGVVAGAAVFAVLLIVAGGIYPEIAGDVQQWGNAVSYQDYQLCERSANRVSVTSLEGNQWVPSAYVLQSSRSGHPPAAEVAGVVFQYQGRPTAWSVDTAKAVVCAGRVTLRNGKVKELGSLSSHNGAYDPPWGKPVAKLELVTFVRGAPDGPGAAAFTKS